MTNRIRQKFAELKRKNKKAFIVFITAGDPSLKITQELVLALEKSGVDLIELGVPFSDPLADGPTIQASSQRALLKKTTLVDILRTVKRIRKKSQIPLALMTYYNPVLHFGEDKLAKKAKACGVDGLIIPDLPPEEADTLRKATHSQGLAMIFFLSPTTTKDRMKKIIRASSGFIYYVSLTGVTGAREKLPDDIIRQVRAAKRYTDKPICVGFGISTPRQIRSIGRIANGIIMGSAIIKEIDKNRGQRGLVKNVARFVARLRKYL